MKKKKAKGPIRDVPAYQKLVEDIGKIFEESRQSGFDFNGKMHFLKCFDCGCFELPVDAQKPAPLKTWICREDGTP
ncbi:MAG: hypothetical protein HGA87_02985, partial [Desulfobulbaceae bacterium]|nr:hypothetical protein [Desulfobulbaceae bacterium]